MDLHIVRESFHKVLKNSDLTVQEFSRKHAVPLWWLYRFHQGKVINPRLNSLERLQKAIEMEAECEH
jgi:predicted transcriptional regulator